jgi:hypothetical protein
MSATSRRLVLNRIVLNRIGLNLTVTGEDGVSLWTSLDNAGVDNRGPSRST